MRLPRVRFTVRLMMAAVAVMALAFELELLRRRNGYSRHHAARCATAERFHLWMARSHRAVSFRYRSRAASDETGYHFLNEQAVLSSRAAMVERSRARRAADRGREFRRAAILPWDSIPPPEAEPFGAVPVDRDEPLEPPATEVRTGPMPGGHRLQGGT
jgi:hypothetical protein